MLLSSFCLSCPRRAEKGQTSFQLIAMGSGCSTLSQHDSCATATVDHKVAITALTADAAWAVDARLYSACDARSFTHVDGGGFLRLQCSTRRCRGAPRHRLPVPRSFETIVQGPHINLEAMQSRPTMAGAQRHSFVQAFHPSESWWLDDNSDPLGHAAATHDRKAEQSIGSTPLTTLSSGRVSAQSPVSSPTLSQTDEVGSVYTFQLACFKELME
jgi:hypothetical protein